MRVRGGSWIEEFRTPTQPATHYWLNGPALSSEALDHPLLVGGFWFLGVSLSSYVGGGM